MKHSFRTLTILLAALICSVAIGARAQDEPVINNVFFQSDLRQAIEDVSAQAGVNILTDPSVQGVVTATLENVSVEEALDILLAGTDFRVEREPNYYLVYTPDLQTNLYAEASESDVVQLRHVGAENARRLLPDPLQRYVRADESRNRLAITAPSELMDRIKQDLRAIDQPGDDTVFMALSNINAESARNLLPERFRSAVQVDTNRNSVSITGSPERTDEIVSLLRRIDRPLPPNYVGTEDVYPTRIVKLNNASAQIAMNLLPEASLRYVRADNETNSLSVSAPPKVANKVLSDIAMIDRDRQRVMLEARIVVLEQNDLLDFGNQFEWPTTTAGYTDTDIGDFYEVRVGYSPTREFTNALSLTINLLSENREATIVSSPQVLAQDGVPSEIRVSTEEYFQITSEDENFIRSDLETIETGTILRITPQVGQNGNLTLDMALEVSDVVARGEQNLPIVNRRTANSKVQIENGGTAAIAGLKNSRSQTTRGGVPGARELPFLGRLFRTDNIDYEAQQVAIFVTATIVDDHDRAMSRGTQEGGSKGTIDEEVFRGQLIEALANMGVQP
ncbi:MAG: secretin and TonB N-terminal domain-containing protein [Roseovarius sp.]